MTEIFRGKKLVWFILLLSFTISLQLTEEFISGIEVQKTPNDFESIIEQDMGLLTAMESVPFLGGVVDAFTINIINAPLWVFAILNIINFLVTLFMAIIMLDVIFNIIQAIPLIG